MPFSFDNAQNIECPAVKKTAGQLHLCMPGFQAMLQDIIKPPKPSPPSPSDSSF